MTAKEIYRPPFRNDGAYIWTADNVMALMATDCMHDPEKLMERTCQILNGEVKSNGNPNLTYVNGEILNGANVILVVRGFGHITGKGGLNLSLEAALQIQDEFGRWVCQKLRNE